VPTKLSRYFGIPALRLQRLGVFNALIGLDNSLFVDPSLLKVAKTREFKIARAELEAYFGNVIRLLKASKKTGDAAWNEAVNRLTFEEEHGAALGYSGIGGHGRGIGPELAGRLCARASEIIALGIDDPAIFELIPLFEEDFGSDRLSDMAVAILRHQFLSYTQRMAVELELPRKDFLIHRERFQLPLHPDGKTPLIFLPTELLNELPLALDWSEIEEVAQFNREVREEWSKLFAGAAGRRVPTKGEIRAILLRRPENIRDLIETYKKSVSVSYDFERDPRGLFDWDEIGRECAEDFPLVLLLTRPKALADLRQVLGAIIGQFKRNIEDNGLYEVLYDDDGKPRRERYSQRLFYAIADAYCAANNVDISREPDAGSGPVDFKLSIGYSGRVLVEVKLSSNPRLVHGFETQLPAYQRSEGTEEAIYLIMQVPGSDSSIMSIIELRQKAQESGRRAPDIFIIDARPKKSASKR